MSTVQHSPVTPRSRTRVAQSKLRSSCDACGQAKVRNPSDWQIQRAKVADMGDPQDQMRSWPARLRALHRAGRDLRLRCVSESREAPTEAAGRLGLVAPGPVASPAAPRL